MVNINVSEQRVTAETTTQLVAGQLNYVPCHVYFDATWTSLKKQIQFRQGNLTLVKKLGDVDMGNFYLPTELTAGPVIIAAMGEGDNVTVLTNEVSLIINSAGYLTDLPENAIDFYALGYKYIARQFDGSKDSETISEITTEPDAFIALPAAESIKYTVDANTGLTITDLPADALTNVTVIVKAETA